MRLKDEIEISEISGPGQFVMTLPNAEGMLDEILVDYDVRGLKTQAPRHEAHT